ncbi:MAG: winged helix-turn-helix domain-containing protein, partial [Acidobacteria bacterium]|nr:winged helix-turn-helix domain-containing protein [Acidobacteriota bacterium]
MKGGNHIPLTQKSFELLEFLILNRGRGLRKNEILNGIWTENFVEEANLAQHIYMVRKALKDNGDTEEYIETIPKYGYRFVGDVTEEFAEAVPLHVSFDPDKKPVEASNGTHPPTPEQLTPLDESREIDISEPQEGVAAIRPRIPTTSNSRAVKLLALAFVFAALFLVAAYVFFSGDKTVSEASAIRSIAILPFSQIGGGADEKLGLGIADSLISKLGNQKEISVSPTSTIVKFLEQGTDSAIEIGEKLGVDAVLTGTIQRENDTVRVNVQLISVRDKTPTWSDKFDSKFSNIFALQDKISEQVATRLSLKLQEPTQVEKNNKYTENIEAYQAYTIGLYYYDQRSEANLPKAIEQFEIAIKNDPNFAPAYALAADSYSLIAYYKFKSMPESEAIAKARQMANKALELDPRSSEALTALGLVALYDKSPE